MDLNDLFKVPKLKNRETVILKREAGLKYFDQAIAQSNRADLIALTIKIAKTMPGVWGNGWSHIAWAAGNAVMETNKRYGIQQSWNLDEAFTPEEMGYLATQLGLDIADYKAAHQRQ